MAGKDETAIPLTGERHNGRAHYGFDGGRVDQGVVDQTCLYCPQDAGLMLRIETGNDDLDSKLSESRRQRGLFRADFDFEVLMRQRPYLQILSGVEPGAGPERNQQIFGWRHSAVRSAIAGRLVADHAMTPRTGFELHISAVLNCDFHKSFQHERCNCPPNVT